MPPAGPERTDGADLSGSGVSLTWTTLMAQNASGPGRGRGGDQVMVLAGSRV